MKWGSLARNLCSGLILTILSLPAWATASITICVENTEFPPFTYFDRAQSVDPRTIGYDVDILELAFKDTPLQYKVIALPWNRCLHLR